MSIMFTSSLKLWSCPSCPIKSHGQQQITRPRIMIIALLIIFLMHLGNFNQIQVSSIPVSSAWPRLTLLCKRPGISRSPNLGTVETWFSMHSVLNLTLWKLYKLLPTAMLRPNARSPSPRQLDSIQSLPVMSIGSNYQPNSIMFGHWNLVQTSWG